MESSTSSPTWIPPGRDHDNAPTAFYTTFGDIMPTDMIVGLLAPR